MGSYPTNPIGMCAGLHFLARIIFWAVLFAYYMPPSSPPETHLIQCFIQPGRSNVIGVMVIYMDQAASEQGAVYKLPYFWGNFEEWRIPSVPSKTARDISHSSRARWQQRQVPHIAFVAAFFAVVNATRFLPSRLSLSSGFIGFVIPHESEVSFDDSSQQIYPTLESRNEAILTNLTHQIGAKDGYIFFVHAARRPSGELCIWYKSS